VSTGRVERLLGAIAAQPGADIALRLCTAASALLAAPGVSVALAGNDAILEIVRATRAARDVDRLQADLGEGPSHDAHRFGWPVLVEDLTEDATWPAFGPSAVALGSRSIFAFPLRRGTVRLGAFTLSRTTTGELRAEEHADALVFARLALDLVLALQSDSPPDLLDDRFFAARSSTAGIHQATGMVSAQLGISVGAGLAVLRAHAFTQGRELRDVAEDVVARRLRLV